MGTSSSHRSPATPAWQQVRGLYSSANPDPAAVASRIVSALEAETRQDMVGPGVVTSLDALLGAAVGISRDGADYLRRLAPPSDQPVLLSLAEALRQEAEQEIASRQYASRFAEIGLNALGSAVLEAGAAGATRPFSVTEQELTRNLATYAHEQRLSDLSVRFLAHDFDHLFRYFVSRDVADFIGGETLPSVADAARLRDRVADYCRQSVLQIGAAAYEEVLSRAMASAPGEGRAEKLTATLTALTEEGLQRLTTGE